MERGGHLARRLPGPTAGSGFRPARFPDEDPSHAEGRFRAGDAALSQLRFSRSVGDIPETEAHGPHAGAGSAGRCGQARVERQRRVDIVGILLAQDR